MMPRRDSKAVEDGVDAYCLGVSRNACPYAPESGEHCDWLRGWDEAEEMDFEEVAEQA